MDKIEIQQALDHISKAHGLVEKCYRINPATPGSGEWLDKRKMLLADLSLHLTDACVKEEMNVENIKRYLYSILIIADDFVPEAGLKDAAQKLLPKPII